MEWSEVRLGDICKHVGYGYTASSEKSPIGPKFLRITDIQGGTVNWNQVPYCKIDSGQKKKYSLSPGDIVIARTGNSTGENYLVQEDIDAVFASYLIRFRVNSKIADPRYVWYCTRSNKFRAFIDGAKTGSAQAGANAKVLGTFTFPLPNLARQMEIAHILGSLDDKIELNRKMNETLEQMARALFKSWFVDFDPVHAKAAGKKPFGMDDATAALFPDSFEESELGLIPKGWRVGKIADLCSRIESGGTPSRNNPLFWDDGKIPWLTSGEIKLSPILHTEEKITQLGLENSSAKILPKYTTVVAMYGATAGKSAIIASDTTANQACCALIPKENSSAFIYIKSRISETTWKSRSRGSAQQNLNKNLVSNLECLIPSSSILSKFHHISHSLLDSIICFSNESNDIEQTRNILLPQLLCGDPS